MLDKEIVRKGIRDEIARFIDGYCSDHRRDPIWREPLVGFADASSPMFGKLKETAYIGHKVPEDYLPGALTVVSYFLPFLPSVLDDNAGGRKPTELWADAYIITNSMATEMNRGIACSIADRGFSAVVPEDAGTILDRTYSCWSQRHVARIAGLGSFGMNNMLITESGCGGRFFSVITDIPCGHDVPFAGERCLHRIDGSCGKCMDACVCGAICGDGFDRDACESVCEGNVALTTVSVCGKCLSGMPCALRDPTSGRRRPLCSEGIRERSCFVGRMV